MLNVDVFSDESLVAAYKRLISVLDFIHEAPGNERQVRDRLFAELEAVERSSTISDKAIAANLCERVTRRLGWSAEADRPLGSEEIVAIAETLDEVRLRCIAAALLSWESNEASDSSQVYHAYEDILSDIDAERRLPIHHGPGQVASAVLGDKLVVLLPSLRNPLQMSQAMDHLQGLFEEHGERMTWIIDFSSVQQIPLLLIANVLTYRQQLRGRSRDLFLCWIRREAFRDIFRERMIKTFDLLEMGGFYHSRATGPS